MNTRAARLAFNRGLVSRFGLARADIKRLAVAAETQTNWISRVLGSMAIRPGFKFLGDTFTDGAARFIPFVFSVTEKALIEITAVNMRVWIDDALVTRPSVSTAVVNGDFAANLGSWTDNDEVGGTSQWTNGHTGGNFSFTGGYMGLTGNGTAAAIRTQQVSVSVTDRGVEHALRIVIAHGPVTLRVGSTSGGDDYITETDLDTGTHSLAFTPTGNFYIQFQARFKRQVLVDSCNVEAAGVMVVTAPWLSADLSKLRHDQSGDIIFIAADGYQQYKIERRATRSWSASAYETYDGPFRVANVGSTTLTPGGLSGNILINSSASLFRATHVGALFRITSDGQTVSSNIVAQNNFTNVIRVEGVGSIRVFTWDTTNVFVANVTLQRSLVSETGPWEDVRGIAAPQTIGIDDGLDNQIAWYRVGVKAGDYTSGTVSVSLNYAAGSITGIVKVTAFVTSTSVDAEVLTDLGSINATDVWSEGSWSDLRGWPTAASFHEGRLAWAGRDRLWMSVSDSFYSFDDNTAGDSGPIARSIGSGPVDTINWLLSLQRLILGGQGSEFSVRSSSLDEPLTPTNFNIKVASTQGAAQVPAVGIDQNGIFVQRGGARIYQLEFGQSGLDYEATDLSALIPDIGSPGIVRIAVQRQPDTRVHFVRSDGSVALLTFDKVENVVCWSEIETDGDIEDAVVLPGNSGEEEDWVYYVVNRSLNGATLRYVEKWAFDSECRPDDDGVLTASKLADSYVTYSGSPTNVITAAHLSNREVVVWAEGSDIGTGDDGNQLYTLDASGNATITSNVSNYVVGLAYEAPWESARLVEIMASPQGSFGDNQVIRGLALVLADVHAQGLKFGRDLISANMDDLPRVGDDGAPVDPDVIRASYTTDPMTFPGDISKDARICLLAKAPRPCTVLAAIADLEHHG